MLKLIKNNENAVVVLHEIYGINEHIKGVCAEYHDRGFDVYCLPLFEYGTPFKYEQQDQAYKNFVSTCGFDATKINLLLGEIRGRYKKIIMIGFSVGATIAWLSAESNLCDGIVCYYGSRIRDYTDIMPQCPVLVIIAQFEKSFDPSVLQKNWLKGQLLRVMYSIVIMVLVTPIVKLIAAETQRLPETWLMILLAQ
ncbi:TPA: dienelactone hydrolase family protein [Salmonella enterica subsp. enterica serovar Kentucky]